MNAQTKICSIHPEHVETSTKAGAEILTITVSDEVFEILTKKASLDEYFRMAGELIRKKKSETECILRA